MSSIRRRFPDAPYALVASADRHRILSEVLDNLVDHSETEMILNPDDENRWRRQLDQVFFDEDSSAPTTASINKNKAGKAVSVNKTVGVFQSIQDAAERAWHSSTVQSVASAIQAVPDWFSSTIRGPGSAAEQTSTGGIVRADQQYKLFRFRLDRLDGDSLAVLANLTGKYLSPDLSLELIIRPDLKEFDSDGDDIEGNPWPRLRKVDQFAARPTTAPADKKSQPQSGSYRISSLR